ncbi:heterokaryon incompatibility protein-domain-containing protein [Lasiosphaeria hispida]|uniref:Heterokaryon incompatibility protein-domain-containing protein n=1 Tax=Lasiosphaeria hispida TaxID=260671 RepID=A0AAJ0HB63_9PEZI|nr:heterokaryon incompatibility protein-domain-containing protein [Lasiosphaeria hispida]
MDGSFKELDTQTDSAGSFGLIDRWIETCAKSHKSCQQTHARRLPTRLLHVTRQDQNGSALMVQLHETNTFPVTSGNTQYAALSYCWGSFHWNAVHAYKLKDGTYQYLKNGIPSDKLPKTIQHAAYATLQLGLCWLWVDALCIFQDSADDWAREAATMADVYRGSHITISALGADSSNGGLFARRDALMYAPFPVAPQTDGVSICVYPAKARDFIEPFRDFPLRKRGWVLQERVLSRRAVGFGPILSWECGELVTDEFNFQIDGWDEPLSMKFHKLLGRYGNTGPITDIASPAAEEFYSFWLSMLKSFSRAGLHLKTDRLQAISGVISVIQSVTGWENVSGLWLPFITHELLWKTSRSWQEGVFQDPRVRTGLPPTWSWISIFGGVLGGLASEAGDATQLASATIHECEDNTVALRLSCALLEGHFLLDDYPDGSQIRLYLQGLYTASFQADFNQATTPKPPEYFVPVLARKDGKGNPTVHGLGVRELKDARGRYERVGYAYSKISTSIDKFRRTIEPQMSSIILV